MKEEHRVINTSENSSSTLRNIGGKEYVVKSVFSDKGDDIESMILKLAERKTMKEMGLDIPLKKSRIA